MDPKIKTVTDLYHNLAGFYANAHVPVDGHKIKGEWIIDQVEAQAIVKVLDVLIDCGADTMIPDA